MIKKSKLFSNSLALLVNRLTQSITTFVLVAAIARMLGPYQLGQYMLAFSYYYVFMTLASQGFKTLFTRELARNPLETPIYLVSGSFLQLLFSLLSYAVLLIVVSVLPYSIDTSMVCYIMGLAIIPFSLSNVTESIFQAQEKMHLIAMSTVPVYLLRLLVIIWVMSAKYDISLVSAVIAISETVILGIEWFLVSKFVSYKWHIDWQFMWRTTKAVRTFLVIEGISVFKDRIQVLTLSLLGGEIVVGLYGAVAQLMQPFQIISYSLVIAIFPSMSKAVTLGKEKQQQLTETTVEILLLVALPLIIGLVFVGQNLLVLLYHNPKFAQAHTALNLLAFGLITSCFTRPLSYILVANGFEKINLWEVLTTTTLGGLLSISLISQYQLNGAATGVVLIQIVGSCIYLYYVYKRLFKLHLWQILRRPLLMSLLMMIVFILLQKISHNLVLTMVAATLAYSLAMVGLGIYTFGGDAVWAKLLPNKK
jgi:O-antigen/teichoic acid export membrane protein